MDSRLDQLESRIAQLEERVTQLAGALGGGAPAREPADGLRDVEPIGDEPAVDAARRQRHPLGSLAGRACLGFAGAFLLRAITDEGLVGPLIGITLGLAYALAWLVAAERYGRDAGSRRGLVHGLIAAAIAYPLLWEMSAASRLLDPVPAALAAGAVSAAFLAVARRIGRESLAWFALIGAATIASGIFFATPAKLAATVLLLVGAFAASELAYSRNWTGPRWVVAIWANLLLLVLIVRTAQLGGGGGGAPDSRTVILVTSLFACSLFSLVSVQILLRRQRAGIFEVLQTVSALVLALGGAAAQARMAGMGTAAVGLVSLALGAGAYALSFVFIRHAMGRGYPFFYYSSLGLVLVLAGTAFLGRGARLGILWMAVALLATWTGVRRERVTLRFHGAAIALAAVAFTGTLAAALPALAGTGALPLLRPERLAVVALVLGCAWQQWRAVDIVRGGWARRAPLALMLGLLAVLSAGLVGQAGLSAWGESGSAAVAAAARTAGGCLAAVGLAFAARRGRRPEPGWIVTPLLIVLGAKLLIEDLGAGSSGTLFLAFLVYGGAWIAAARLGRNREESVGTAPAASPPRPLPGGPR